jgi:hypothetical protein
MRYSPKPDMGKDETICNPFRLAHEKLRKEFL